MPDTDPATSALEEIREHNERVIALCDMAPARIQQLAEYDVPRLLKAVEAALTGAGTLDAESARFGKIAEDADPGSAVEVAALAAWQAYDRSARILREAITTELTGKEAGDADPR